MSYLALFAAGALALATIFVSTGSAVVVALLAAAAFAALALVLWMLDARAPRHPPRGPRTA